MSVRHLHGEQLLVDGLLEPVHDPGPVEVEPGRFLVLQGVEACTLGEGLSALVEAVAPQRLKEGMARGHPLQVPLIRRGPVGGDPWVPGRDLRQVPVGGSLITLNARGSGTRFEGVELPPDGSHGQVRFLRAVLQEAGDGFGHYPVFLRLGPPLHQQVQVELAGCQSLQGGLADGPEALLVHVPEEPVFQVFLAQPSGVVVPEHPLHLGGGQDLSHHVEDRVVVQGITDLLELVQESLEYPPLDGVGGDEVEDQAVKLLAIPVDAPHPLFQAVGVPGDVVVEEDVAALEVDALAGRLGGHQDLDVPLTELLLHEEPGPRLVPRPCLHSAMDLPRAESPELEAV